MLCQTSGHAGYKTCGYQVCSPGDARIPDFGENDKRNFKMRNADFTLLLLVAAIWQQQATITRVQAMRRGMGLENPAEPKDISRKAAKTRRKDLNLDFLKPNDTVFLCELSAFARKMLSDL
jgi:hypothetical protein